MTNQLSRAQYLALDRDGRRKARENHQLDALLAGTPVASPPERGSDPEPAAPEPTPAAPSLAGAGAVGQSIGGDIAGPIESREAYRNMSPDERREARRTGRLNQLLGISEA